MRLTVVMQPIQPILNEWAGIALKLTLLAAIAGGVHVYADTGLYAGPHGPGTSHQRLIRPLYSRGPPWNPRGLAERSGLLSVWSGGV